MAKKANSQHVVTAGGGLFFDDSVHGRIGLKAPRPPAGSRGSKPTGTHDVGGRSGRGSSSSGKATPTRDAGARSARGSSSASGSSQSSGSDRAQYIRDAVARTARGAPETMVRIVSAAKTISGARGAVRYVTKHGTAALENERGQTWEGKRAVQQATRTWERGGMGIPKEGTRREALHMILSMPPSADRERVTDAARAFARTELAGHRYVFAPHEDTEHRHVHLVVVMGRDDGQGRLNPRKPDLERWRETFAHELRERGIDANATRRVVRGVVQKEARRPGRALGEAPSSRPIVASPETQKAIESQWSALAAALDAGDDADRKLAQEARGFVERMPVRALVRERGAQVDGPSVDH